MDIEYTDLFIPNSSAIVEMYFDSESNQIYIEFPSGDVWQYQGNPTMWKNWTGSASVGSFYSHFVKGKVAGGYIGRDGQITWVALTPDEPEAVARYEFTAEVTSTVIEVVEVPVGLNDIHDAIGKFASKYPGAKIRAIASA